MGSWTVDESVSNVQYNSTLHVAPMLNTNKIFSLSIPKPIQIVLYRYTDLASPCIVNSLQYEFIYF